MLALFRTLFLLAALGIAAPALAASFSNAGDPAGGIDSFGAGPASSAYYGQVFTAPAGMLQSWSFNLDAADAGHFILVIAPWAAGDVLGGAPLYISAAVAGVPGGFADYAFTGISLALTLGSDYIAYLTTAGVADPLLAASVSGAGSDGGLGGGFRFWDGSNPDWSSWFIPSLSFTAVFADAAAVPAPPAFAVLLAGLVGLGLVRRRRAD